MQVLFRKLTDGDGPAPGELLIRARRERHGDCRTLSCLVLDHGLDALEQGPGPLERIIVSADPTLDDLLAALLVQRRLAGDPVPGSFPAFARYAGLVREGLRPSDVPVEVSPEGVFQAIRREAGNELSDPEARQRFLAGWSRMAARITQAAEAGHDPFTAPLFAAGHEFARERTYLAGDRAVYRQDARRGETWRVQLPGAAPGFGLLLREPQSLMFARWSRDTGAAPDGGAYLFLAVDWGKGEWVFSTDPLLRLSLKPLADLLQKAEAERDPEHARRHPWYDGASRRHTLIAAPHGGTRLPEETVLGAVRAWTRAEALDRPAARVRRFPRLRGWTGAGAGVMLIVCLLLVLYFVPRARSSIATRLAHYQVSSVMVNGEPVARPRGFDPDSGSDGPVFWVEQPLVLQGDWQNEATVEVAARSTAEPQDVRLWVTLEADHPLPVDEVRIRLNDGEEYGGPVQRGGDGTVRTAEHPGVLQPGGHNRIRLRLHNTGADKLSTKIRLNWRNTDSPVNLYLLSVGIAEYEDKSLRLALAAQDATDLTGGFQAEQGQLFGQVQANRLVNDQATRSAILKELKRLVSLAREQQLREHDLIVLTFSGHGERAESGEFYFLPWDYKPSEEPEDTGLSWYAIWQYVARLPCRVVVVMDACHAGAIRLDSLGDSLQRAQGRLPKSGRGVVLIAACLSDQSAYELPQWKHGPLSQCLLDCLDGDARQWSQAVEDSDGIVTLAAAYLYASRRIKKELKNKVQEPILCPTGDIAADSIEIARRPRSGQ
jgi:hypothetical protein